jgi:uncharacterized protein (DUF1015 family)
VAAQVASVPYDVVNREEARKLAQGSKLSFLRVSRPEIELPESTDPYSPAVYERARANLAELTREAPLIRETDPALYIYRLTRNGRTQTGIVGTFSIDEYDSGAIRKHERTRKDKEDDRTRHVLALEAQTGPVFLTFKDVPELDRETAQGTRGAPLYSFTAPDGVLHEAWRVPQHDRIVELFGASVPALYIADGHHRAAAASRARAELRARSASERPLDRDFVLAVAFPASQLTILPYYRVVLDLGGVGEKELMSGLERSFAIERVDAAVEPAKGEFGLCRREGGRVQWYRLAPKARRGDLDVTLLQDYVLGPILGIQDPRTDPRIDFVGGIRGTRELESRLLAGAAAAFSMHPTRIEEVMEISDQGGIMPPKSTWFEPKLRDGLFSHLI